MKPWIWVQQALLLAFHERLLAEHRGIHGNRSEGLLDSALGKPQNLLAYDQPNLFGLAVSYGSELMKIIRSSMETSVQLVDGDFISGIEWCPFWSIRSRCRGGNVSIGGGRKLRGGLCTRAGGQLFQEDLKPDTHVSPDLGRIAQDSRPVAYAPR